MIKGVFFLITFIVLVSSMALINPLLSGQMNVYQYRQNLQRDRGIATFINEETTEQKPGPPQFLYRSDNQRTGVHKVSNLFKKLETSHLGPQINFGIHTASKSSVAADDSGYYVGTDEGKLLAFDFNNQLRWEIDFISSGRGIHGTATTDNLYLYIGNYNGHLLCIRKSDGRIMWDVDLADAIGTSPLVAGDFIYVTAEYNKSASLVAKLSKKTGEKIWLSEIFGEQSHSSPALSEDERVVIVGDNAGILRGLDTRNGNRIWQQKLGGPIKGTPMIYSKNVFVGSWGKDFCSLNVASGENNWCVDVGGIVQSSAVLDPQSGDIIIQTANKTTLMKVDSQSGRLKWKMKFPAGARAGISSPVTIVSGKNQSQILATCNKGTLCLIDSKTGVVISSAEAGSAFSGAPTIFKNEVFISLDLGGISRIRLN